MTDIALNSTKAPAITGAFVLLIKCTKMGEFIKQI